MFKRICLFVVVTMSGCSSSNKDKIEGTKWVSDEVTKEKSFVPKSGIRLEFHSDGALTWKSGETTVKGKYVLRSGDVVSFEFEEPIAEATRHNERIVVREKSLTLSDAKEKIGFQRE